MPETSSTAVQTGSLTEADDALVLAAQKDPAAFQWLYDRWVVPVYQYFYHRTGEMTSAQGAAVAAWSPDGRWLLLGTFDAGLDGSQTSNYLVQPDTCEVVPLPHIPDPVAAWRLGCLDLVFEPYSRQK